MNTITKALLCASLLTTGMPACLVESDSAGIESSTQELRKPFADFDLEGKKNPPWRNGVLLAKVSQATYAVKAQRGQKLSALGLSELAFIDRNDSQALVAAND